MVVPYSKTACQKLLQQIADSAANENLPGDYDFCLTVISNVGPFRPSQPLEDDGVSGPAPRAMARSATAASAEGGAEEEEEDTPDITSALRSYGYSPEEIKEFKEVGCMSDKGSQSGYISSPVFKDIRECRG
jgi:hypothetical protein